ncbi:MULTISPECIES: Crp/Fnr family transcriptional regulator [unclassified Candidatus Frackibacter]|uniref:Crp/Fnr family transcriptional regulator n=1 Tax=unclassified Candidatus Frackibacter TaxID=2648818 RepID=UPI00088F424C|nr:MULTISPECIES: Crp/Fnr family transcriptional regulator [unclassified Candidatus Frackibacter]SDC72081.1 Crp-like helix-turn-helix domain-containing protein [Candidatus Frackibacter sp. WG11]SEM86360.1 Crp-like helix-turn-helix domain-containing protein [Candidatus Frackibacter sp. WG12]SFL95436.1 Crp-like helix-turn-helix domain-containing protein [Candidatus Frackibacter sp. WG13]
MTTLDFLSETSLFSNLSQEQLKKIEMITSTKEVPADKMLFFENEPGDVVYLIVSGRVKISKISASGREKTLAILEDGDIFGEISLLDGGLRSATAQVLKNTKLLIIHRQDFLKVIHKYPEIGSKIIAVLSQRLRDTNRQLSNAHFKTVTERTKDLLLKLVDEEGKEVTEGIMIEKSLTHEELAGLIGTSRESMTRTLNKLQKQGWLRTTNKGIIIFD